ncbi:pyridoxal phosphate-dependent transferase [Aspergillus crustosus]
MDLPRVIAHYARADAIHLCDIDTNAIPDPVNLAMRNYAIELGFPALNNAIARHASIMSGRRYGADANTSTISTGWGLISAVNSVIDDRKEVVVVFPTSQAHIRAILHAGGIPVSVPLIFRPGMAWWLDMEGLEAAVTDKTSALLLQSPSIPTGAYITASCWAAIARMCVRKNVVLIYDSLFDAVRFDGRPHVHPAAFMGMDERTLTVGCGSGLYGMNVLQFDWVVGPPGPIARVAAISNMAGRPPADLLASEAISYRLASSMEIAVQGRQFAVRALSGLPFGYPAGGWSMVVDVGALGFSSLEAARQLGQQGVCVTPIPIPPGVEGLKARHYIQIVFWTLEEWYVLSVRVRAALRTNILAN